MALKHHSEAVEPALLEITMGGRFGSPGGETRREMRFVGRVLQRFLVGRNRQRDVTFREGDLAEQHRC